MTWRGGIGVDPLGGAFLVVRDISALDDNPTKQTHSRCRAETTQIFQHHHKAAGVQRIRRYKKPKKPEQDTHSSQSKGKPQRRADTMFDELADEVEAINSIYGEDTLTPYEDGATTADNSRAYILQLPKADDGDENDATSLRLEFPAGYPSAPPSVPSTHHSSGGRRGAGARDLDLFRRCVGDVFQAGVVCIFDAVEEFVRVQEALAAEAEEEDDDNEGQGRGTAAHRYERDEMGVDLSSLPAPPWTVSEPFVENRSTFVAHVAPVASPDLARRYVAQLLDSDRRIRDATHNMTAWRIRGTPGDAGAATITYQDCDDDGETAAGSRLLHLMQLMDLWDAMVVVTRWYGGVKLGPRRFAIINAAARDGFVRAGMVVDKQKEGGSKKKGK